jgi:hypothetical protein
MERYGPDLMGGQSEDHFAYRGRLVYVDLHLPALMIRHEDGSTSDLEWHDADLHTRRWIEVRCLPLLGRLVWFRYKAGARAPLMIREIRSRWSPEE